MSSTSSTTKSTYKTAILSTTAIVVLLGAQTMFFMLQPPRSLQVAKASPVMAQPAMTTGLRTPASTTLSESDGIATIHLACDGPQETVLSHEMTQVRLKGGYCAGQSQRSGSKSTNANPVIEVTSEVINDANGFSATVFPLKNRMFTTDFISLTSGLNRIRLLHSYSNGEREAREYLIERQKPQ